MSELVGTIKTIGPNYLIFENDMTIGNPFQMDLQFGDVVHARINQGQFVTYPFVTISYKPEVIFQVLTAGLISTNVRVPEEKVKILYQQLTEKFRTGLELADYLDHLSLKYGAPLYPLSPIATIMLMKYWKKVRVLRQFQLWGLNKIQIYSYAKYACSDICELRKMLLTKPGCVFTLNPQQMQKFLSLSLQSLTPLEVEAYYVVQELYQQLMQRNIVNRPQPSTFCRQLLEQQYPVIREQEFWYLKYPGLVLQYLREKIRELRNRRNLNAQPIIHYALDSFSLSPDQLEALNLALTSNFLAITGAAGTGKTTLLKALVLISEARGVSYIVGAFTGKAVAQIRKVLGTDQPMTLDRLISRAKNGKVGADLLIIDEVSMLSMELLYRTLKVFQGTPRIIMFGDPNQIPPISWGHTLNSLLQSGAPHYQLSHVHRCHDLLLQNPHRIIQGLPLVPNDSFIITDLPPLEIYKKALGKWSAQEITIITPYVSAAAKLNAAISRVLFDSTEQFCIGDRVMFIKNSDQADVFNGQEATVSAIDETYLTVQVKDREIMLQRVPEKKKADIDDVIREGEGWFEKDPPLDTNLIERSYALTIDKSQGSEWPITIFYLPMRKANEWFLERRRIYTSMTRVQVLKFVTGEIDDINAAIARFEPEPVPSL